MRPKLHPARKPKGKDWLYCRLCDMELLVAKREAHDVSEPHASLARRYRMDAALDRMIPYRCERLLYFDVLAARLDNILYDSRRAARSDRGVSPAAHSGP